MSRRLTNRDLAIMLEALDALRCMRPPRLTLGELSRAEKLLESIEESAATAPKGIR